MFLPTRSTSCTVSQTVYILLHILTLQIFFLFINRQTLNLLIFTLAGLGLQSSSIYLPAHMRWIHLKAVSSTAGAEVGQQETGEIATAGNVALFSLVIADFFRYINFRYTNLFSLTLILLIFICKQSWATRNRKDCHGREHCPFSSCNCRFF